MAESVAKVDAVTFALLTAVAKAAEATDVRWMVTGAWGRVLLLENVYGLPVGLATEDVDFAVMVESWPHYHRLVADICRDPNFTKDPKQAQRIRYRTEFYLDLVPFGGVESETQQIAWPPQGDFVMSVAGFHDALADAVPVWVNDSLSVPVVSPAGLLLLKLLAWNERRNQKPGRDASDIAYVLRHAVKLISERLLFEERLSVVDGLGYDIDLAAAYALGGQIRALASAKTRKQLLTVLAPPATEAEDAMLVRDVSAYMLSEDSERVGARLRQLKAGFEAKPDMDTA